MSEEKKQGRRRPRRKQTYQHHKNAVNLTVYDPSGDTIPAPVRDEIANCVMGVAAKHRLFINLAYE